MSRKTIFLILAVAAFFVGALHLLSLRYYLYYFLPWMDLVVHTLGGIVVFTPLFLHFQARMSALKAFSFGIGGLFLVDMGWELFEYAQGLTRIEPGFFFDAASDTIASFVGAFLMFSLISAFERTEA